MLKKKKLLKITNWFICPLGKNVKPSPMEKKIAVVLKKLKVIYHTEVSYKGLNPTKTPNGYYRFDFCIPAKNLLIEYDGQGFHDSLAQQKRDALKNKYCKSHNFNLVRLTKKDLPLLEKILKSLTN